MYLASHMYSFLACPRLRAGPCMKTTTSDEPSLGVSGINCTKGPRKSLNILVHEPYNSPTKALIKKNLVTKLLYSLSYTFL